MPEDKVKNAYSTIQSTGVFIDENDFSEQLKANPQEVFEIFNSTDDTKGIFIDYNDFSESLGLGKQPSAPTGSIGGDTNLPSQSEGLGAMEVSPEQIQNEEPQVFTEQKKRQDNIEFGKMYFSLPKEERPKANKGEVKKALQSSIEQAADLTQQYQQLEQAMAGMYQNIQQNTQQLQDPNLDPETRAFMEQDTQRMQQEFDAARPYAKQLFQRRETALKDYESIAIQVEKSIPDFLSPTQTAGATIFNLAVDAIAGIGREMKAFGEVDKEGNPVNFTLFGETVMESKEGRTFVGELFSRMGDNILKVKDSKLNIGVLAPSTQAGLFDGDLTANKAAAFVANVTGSMGLMLVPYAGSSLMFSNIFENSYESAKEAGYSDNDAYLFATGVAIPVMAMEKIGFGSIIKAWMRNPETKAVMQKYVSEQMKKGASPEAIYKSGLQYLKEAAKPFLKETATETIQEVYTAGAEVVTDKIATPESGIGFETDMTSMESFKRYGEAFIGGALGGAIGSAGTIGSRTANEIMPLDRIYNFIASQKKEGADYATEFKQYVQGRVDNGDITSEDQNEINKNFDNLNESFKLIPNEIVKPKDQVEAAKLLTEKQVIQEQKETTDEALHAPIDAKLAKIDEQLKKIANKYVTESEEKQSKTKQDESNRQEELDGVQKTGNENQGGQDGQQLRAQEAEQEEVAVEPSAIDKGQDVGGDGVGGEVKTARFEIGKQLNEKEKKEVLGTLQDSYRVNKRPYTIDESPNSGRERKVYLENMYDYMHQSGVTGQKVRWYITLPDGRIAHPTEVYGNVSMSEVERFAKNIEYADDANEANYNKGLKNIKDTKKVAEILSSSIDDGFIKIRTLRNDYGEIVDVRIVPNEDNPKFTHGIADYINNITDEKTISDNIPNGFDVERFISEQSFKEQPKAEPKVQEEGAEVTPVQQTEETTPETTEVAPETKEKSKEDDIEARRQEELKESVDGYEYETRYRPDVAKKFDEVLQSWIKIGENSGERNPAYAEKVEQHKETQRKYREINAKYDAELKALEQSKTKQDESTEKTEQEESMLEGVRANRDEREGQQESAELRSQKEKIRKQAKEEVLKVVDDDSLTDQQKEEKIKQIVDAAKAQMNITENDLRAASVNFELPSLNIEVATPFKKALKELGYSDADIANMTIEQQQEIVSKKTQAPVVESSAKVDAVKENERQERIAAMQAELDLEVAQEEIAVEPSAVDKGQDAGGEVAPDVSKEAVNKNVNPIFKPFVDIIDSSKNFEEAYKKIKDIKDVPKEVADAFSEKYNPDNNLLQKEAFAAFYNEVKGLSSKDNKATSKEELNKLESEFVDLTNKVYTKTGKEKKNAKQSDIKRLGDVKKELQEKGMEFVLDEEKAFREQQIKDTEQANKDFQDTAYKGLSEQEKLEAVVEDKLASQEKLTDAEKEWANKNLFLPTGFELDNGGNLIKQKKENAEQDLELVKAEEVLSKLGERKVSDGKGSWRKEFNKTKDPFRKSDILRAIADISTNPIEQADILEAAKGMPKESGIVNAVESKQKATIDTEKAEKKPQPETKPEKAAEKGEEKVAPKSAASAFAAALTEEAEKVMPKTEKDVKKEKAKKAIDDAAERLKALLKPKGVDPNISKMGISVDDIVGVIADAVKALVNAGIDTQDAIKQVMDKFKPIIDESEFSFKDVDSKTKERFEEKAKPKMSESSIKKRIVDNIQANKALSDVAEDIKNNGISYEVANQEQAEQVAKAIIDEFGDLTVPENATRAFDFVKNNNLRGDVRNFALGLIIDGISVDIQSLNPMVQNQLRETIKDVVNFLADKNLDEGRANSIMNRIYMRSKMGFYMYTLAEIERENKKKANGYKGQQDSDKPKNKIKQSQKDFEKAQKEAAKEAAEKITATTEKAKKSTTKERGKSLADSIRKNAKINRPGMFMTATPASVAWDTAIEVVATTIEQGSALLSEAELLAEAIKKGIESLRKNKWFNSLSDTDKSKAEKEFLNYFEKKEESAVKPNVPLWEQYASSAVETLRSHIEKQINKAKPKEIAALDEFTKRLKDNVIKKLNEGGKKIKKEGLSAIDIITEIAKNTDKYFDVIERTIAELEDSGMSYSEISNAVDLMMNLVYDKSTKKLVQDVVKQEIKDSAIDIDKVLLQAHEIRAKSEQDFALQLRERLVNEGVDSSSATTLANQFAKEYGRILEKRAMANLNQSFTGTEVPTAPIASRPAQHKLIVKQILWGAFDKINGRLNEDGSYTTFFDLFAKKYGLLEVTPETQRVLENFAENISKTTPNSSEWHFLNNEMQKYIDFKKGESFTFSSLALAQFYGNIFLSPNTAMRAWNPNIMNTAFSFTSKVVRNLAEGRFGALKLLLKSVYGDKGMGVLNLRRGKTEAYLGLHGYSLDDGDSKLVSEQLAKYGQGFSKIWGKYASFSKRMLSSIDLLVSSGGRQMMYADLIYERLSIANNKLPKNERFSQSELSDMVSYALGYNADVVINAESRIDKMFSEIYSPEELQDKVVKARRKLAIMDLINMETGQRLDEELNRNDWTEAYLSAQDLKVYESQAKEYGKKLGMMGMPEGSSGVLAAWLSTPGKLVPTSKIYFATIVNAAINSANAFLNGTPVIGGIVTASRITRSKRGFGVSVDAAQKFGIRTDFFGARDNNNKRFNMEKREILIKFLMAQSGSFALLGLAIKAIQKELGDDDDDDKQASFKRLVVEGRWKKLPYFVTGSNYGAFRYEENKAVLNAYGIDEYSVYSYGVKIADYKNNPLLGMFFSQQGAYTDQKVFQRELNQTDLGMAVAMTFGQLYMIKEQSSLISISRFIDAVLGADRSSGKNPEAKAEAVGRSLAKNFLQSARALVIPSGVPYIYNNVQGSGLIGSFNEKNAKDWWEIGVKGIPIAEDILLNQEAFDHFGNPIPKTTKSESPLMGLKVIDFQNGEPRMPLVQGIYENEKASKKFYDLFFSKGSVSYKFSKDKKYYTFEGDKVVQKTLTEKELSEVNVKVAEGLRKYLSVQSNYESLERMPIENFNRLIGQVKGFEREKALYEMAKTPLAPKKEYDLQEEGSSSPSLENRDKAFYKKQMEKLKKEREKLTK